jgi:hypothetical protein
VIKSKIGTAVYYGAAGMIIVEAQRSAAADNAILVVGTTDLHAA